MELDVEQFAMRFEHLFLVRTPPQVLGPASEAPPLTFRTQALKVRRPRVVEDDELGKTWLVEAVKKKPGQPFPERITVGRAVNCDISVRVSYISKLHAYLIADPQGTLRVVDNNSANGTWVAGKRLRRGEPCVVDVGAEIELGALRLAVLDARLVHALLRRQVESPEGEGTDRSSSGL